VLEHEGRFAITALFVQMCSGWFWGLASILIKEIPLVVLGVKNTTFFLQPTWTDTGGPDRELGSPLLSVAGDNRDDCSYACADRFLCSRNELMSKVDERIHVLEGKLEQRLRQSIATLLLGSVFALLVTASHPVFARIGKCTMGSLTCRSPRRERFVVEGGEGRI
jgi:hypothetical protein